jgi:hypothetical protein
LCSRGATHTHLGARRSRRRLSSRGRKATAHSTREATIAALRCRRERVKPQTAGSDRGRLELAEGVVGAPADLARDGQSRHGGVAPLPDRPVELEIWSGCPVCVHSAAPPTEQAARLHRLGQPDVEPAHGQLAPHSAPAGRRLHHHRRDPAAIGPASKAVSVRGEALFDDLAALRIKHGRLKRVLMDVDRRLLHLGPPLVEGRGPIVPTAQYEALMASTLSDVTRG